MFLVWLDDNGAVCRRKCLGQALQRGDGHAGAAPRRLDRPIAVAAFGNTPRASAVAAPAGETEFAITLGDMFIKPNSIEVAAGKPVTVDFEIKE